MPFGKRPIIADALDIAGWLALAFVVVGLVFDRGALDGIEPFGIFAAAKSVKVVYGDRAILYLIKLRAA